MHIYTGYGFCIHSEISIPELTASSGEPDITVCIGKISAAQKQTADSAQHFLGYLERAGTALIEEGRQITLEPETGADESLLRSTITGPAMSIILRQRGFLVLHASSIAIGNEAVAFIGGSGWGKSTLASAFHAQGHNILTEDVTAIKIGTSRPIVIPSFPQLRLWKEAAISLGHDVNYLPPIEPNSQKLLYQFSHGFQQTPLPLKQIYVLAKGVEHKIDQLSPQDAFAALICHTRGANLLKSPAFVTSHLHQCANLISNAESYRFTRKPGLEELARLVKMIEDNVVKELNIDTNTLKLNSV